MLDFDNKADETPHSGLDLVKKLNMDQYDAPKHKTPSRGYHYIFYVDAQQKERINSRTTITYQGVVYNMDAKFKNGLRNCAPSKIKGLRQIRVDQRVVGEAQEHPEAPRPAF